MDYEDMIEEESKPEGEMPETEVEAVPEDPRPKSPWKAFILTGFLAGLIGAAGGGYGAYAALKKFAPVPPTLAAVDLSPIETRLRQLSDRVTEAEAEALEAANSPTVEFEPVDLSGLEARLDALEAAPKPEIDPDALTALQAAQADGFEWPDTSLLEGRIAGLEAQEETASETALPPDLMDRLAALEANVETIETAVPALGLDGKALTDLEARLKTLETRPVPSAPVDAKKLNALTARINALETRPAPKPVVERVSILAFPKASMIAAAEDNVDGGLIKKTISQHIRLNNANDPFTLIEGIETDISEGQLAAAIEKFERLPSPVRSAGQAWYESVKASL